MGRRVAPEPSPYPPIPPALRELINDEGRYRFNGFVLNPDGTVRHDGRWESYKKLRNEYCAAAGIPTHQFAAIARDDLDRRGQRR